MPSKVKSTRFKNEQAIEQDSSARIFTAQDKKTNTRLLVRSIKSGVLSEGARSDIEQQLEHLKRLDIPDLIVPELQIDDDENIQIISPYPKGFSFRDWLKDHRTHDIRSVLEFGISLLDGLVLRHSAALIHKSIKPTSIQVQIDPIRVQLLNEVQLADSKQFDKFANTPYFLRETFPYLAPEVGGRIRSHVDYCSDLYAVGIVLYECITGAPPFVSDDSLSILHSHLAEKPRPVSELNEYCPPVVSDIIDILLQKQPENRYQSASGLRADLKICLSTLKYDKNSHSAVPVIPVFELRQHESSFHISTQSIMVGREEEQKQLLDEYQRVCTGKLGLVTLSGLSGVGKTRLIQELELPIVANHSYFTFGKFNQFATHLPYNTLLGAFSRMIRQILSEDSERIQYWREQMLTVLGPNGKLITDLIPELELIVGKQPEISSLPANEARNRFADLFSRFMGCLATEAHPLVLFLDDMQWCDQGTFDLLELIYLQPDRHPFLLIIAAYRSNEVSEDHPVRLMEVAIESSTQPILKLELSPLGRPAVNQMAAYILNTNPSRTNKLADEIYSITGGNPLYVSEAMRWLHQHERIELAKDGSWQWEEGSIDIAHIPSSIAELFLEKMTAFPPKPRDLLATGSLLGAQFDGADLADIAQISVSELYIEFEEVFAQRILLADRGRLYFFHDQIQMAAANFLDDEQRKQRHRAIARVYIERVDAGAVIPSTLLFSIVEHMAAGRLEHATDAEKFEEAEFNYRAGAAALESLALDAGNHYLSQSNQLSSESMWNDQYEFMLRLHKKLAHAALLNADQVGANAIVERSLKYVQNAYDKAEFLYDQSVAYAVLGDLPKAIDIASHALLLLDRPLPSLDDDIQQEIAVMESRIHDIDRDYLTELLDLPHADGPVAVLIHKLYGELLGYLFFNGQMEMTRLTAYRAIDCTTEFGSDDFVCYALGAIAYLLAADDHFTMAYRYETATSGLVKQYPDTFGAVKAKGTLVWAVMHLRQPMTELRNYARDAAEESLRCGELRYAMLAKSAEHWFSYVQGDDLPLLNNELNKMTSFSLQCNLAITVAVGEAMQFSLRPLLRQPDSPESYSIADSEIEGIVQQWSENGLSLASACYYTFAGMVAYFNHEYSKSAEFLKHAEPLLPAIGASIVERIWYIFSYLNGLKNDSKKGNELYLEKLRRWASEGPMLAPYMMLIEAETVVKEGDFQGTRNHLLNAIDSANQARYGLLEAFLNERLYDHFSENQHHLSESYRNQANFLYERCGAVNRVQSVITGFRKHGEGTPTKKTAAVQPVHSADSELDVRFLFDAAKSISSELDLNKLMGNILAAVMARLGAKNGYLLIAEDNLLQPVFKGIKYEEVTVFSRDDESFNTDTLSMAISNYVYNSKDTVILGNAAEKGEFVADKVVNDNQLKSILCMPIIMQQQILGVLYFENSLIESIFTEEQIDQADLLTSQAAIALQNSKLLNDAIFAQSLIEEMNRDLESKVEQRTAELERKQLELTHAGRLASLGELATGIAHELGQPLQIIQAASRIIQEELGSDEFEKNELITFSKDIVEQVDRATSIIKSIRSFARSDDSLDAEAIDVSVPFYQCLAFFTEQFHQNQINLVLEIEKGLPAVLASPQKFQQIVVNFLSNARHAVDEKYRNNDETYHKQIIARLYVGADKSSVILEVEDNGAGMNKEQTLKCLNPFFTTKEVGEGTGLGLSIVHGLIKEFNFSLKIESEINQGSVFRVTMPVLDETNNPDVQEK